MICFAGYIKVRSTESMKKQNLKILSSMLLLITAFIWGIAFVAQSVGMDHVGPWTFVFFRYTLSAAVLIPVSVFTGKKLKKNRPAGYSSGNTAGDYIKGGLVCGIFLGTASISQQAGLQYTTTGKAGFITALYVVLVPVLGLIIGRKPSRRVWICVVLGIGGLYLISVKEGFTIASGDILVMLCAFLFSFQIMGVDHFSAKLENAVLLSNLQFAVAAVFGGIGMLIFEKPVMSDVMAAAVPILYAGVLSGAVGYTLQIISQRNTDPAVASLIMSLESVFSAIAGWVILGQTMSPRELAGCALVMAAVILAQIPVGRIRKGSR